MIRAAAIVIVATLCLSCSFSEHVYNHQHYVVRSAADASLVGLASSAEDAVVHASFVGPVVLRDPIKVRQGRAGKPGTDLATACLSRATATNGK